MILLIQEITRESIFTVAGFSAIAGVLGNLIKGSGLKELVAMWRERAQKKEAALKAKLDYKSKQLEVSKERTKEIEKQLELEKQRFENLQNEFNISKMQITTILNTIEKFTNDDEVKKIINHLVEILEINTTPAQT